MKKDKILQILHKRIFGDFLSHRTIRSILNIVTRGIAKKYLKTPLTIF